MLLTSEEHKVVYIGRNMEYDVIYIGSGDVVRAQSCLERDDVSEVEVYGPFGRQEALELEKRWIQEHRSTVKNVMHTSMPVRHRLSISVKERKRQIHEMVDYQGMSQADVARVLGVSRQLVNKIYHGHTP